MGKYMSGIAKLNRKRKASKRDIAVQAMSHPRIQSLFGNFRKFKSSDTIFIFPLPYFLLKKPL
jgi:hypothetical protein